MDKFDVDSALVHKLADLLAETGLGEIKYEADGKRVRVARPNGAAPHGGAHTATDTAPPAPAAAAEPTGDLNGDALAAHPGAVTSPLVGIVFLSRSPGEPAFVNIGNEVAAGQTLMLIEAMKTYNEVRAGRAGRLVQIAVADHQPVEFGEVLAVIE